MLIDCIVINSWATLSLLVLVVCLSEHNKQAMSGFIVFLAVSTGQAWACICAHGSTHLIGAIS